MDRSPDWRGTVGRLTRESLGTKGAHRLLLSHIGRPLEDTAPSFYCSPVWPLNIIILVSLSLMPAWVILGLSCLVVSKWALWGAWTFCCLYTTLNNPAWGVIAHPEWKLLDFTFTVKLNELYEWHVYKLEANWCFTSFFNPEQILFKEHILYRFSISEYMGKTRVTECGYNEWVSFSL